ncbi:hypothetical protein MY11210_002091 [Beauveria gryllotalpidicola]
MDLDTDVLIIGAGMSGLGFAVQLVKTHGHGSFEIVEKEEHIGGTWWVNSYPGCGVDVVSHYYSYSFCMNPNWSRMYPLQPEILAYYEMVAAKYGIEKHIRLQTKVESADVSTAMQILISAVGILSEPNKCHIKGYKSFQGALFHSAQWDHSFDYQGKQVVVIAPVRLSQPSRKATGQVKKVTQFARQAQWVFERTNPEYTDNFKLVMRWVPFAMRAYRAMHNYYTEMDFKSFPTEAGAAIRNMYANYQGAYIKSASPEKYHDFLIPKSLGRDNVELVYSDPIEEILPGGVRTRSGRIVDADAIVLANGFQVQKPLLTLNLHGRGGVSVADHASLDKFSQGASSAYFGTCLSEFPNYFIMMGAQHRERPRLLLKALRAQRSSLPVLRQANRRSLRESRTPSSATSTTCKRGPRTWSGPPGAPRGALDETTRRNTTMYPDFQYKYWLRSVFVAWNDLQFTTSPALAKSLASKPIAVGT